MSEETKAKQADHRDFTGVGWASVPFHRGSTGNEEIDRRISELVADWKCGQNGSLIEEMIITALKLGHDQVGVGELKLLNRALKEMRTAENVFHPYQHRRKVSVYGSARTDPSAPEYKAAVEFGRKMAEKDYMVITGAGDGIMGAANEGAGRESSFGLSINLPFETGANETIRGDLKLIDFNYFFTRKLSFVKEADAVAFFPGGFGTMDEGFEQLTLIQTGKTTVVPLVAVDAPGGTYWKTWKQFLEEHLLRRGLISEEDFYLFKVTDDLDEAVEEILGFYRVFHSYRFVKGKMVIRLKEKLSEGAVKQLNADFSGMLEKGEIFQSKAFKEEADEPSLMSLPRLVCSPKRKGYGMYRKLIDAINQAETESAAK
ncbi:MAG: LOG family protein [Verrucomicrobiota bacterium]